MIRFSKRELNHTCTISSESKYPEKLLNACVRSYMYEQEKRAKKIFKRKKISALMDTTLNGSKNDIFGDEIEKH